MTIDEAIEELKSKNGYYVNNGMTDVAEFNTKIIRWLEELKLSRQKLNELRKYSYVQGLSDGYINAIDDFVKKINESNQGHWRPTRYEHGEVVSETMSYDIGTIKLIAEQLKAHK